MSSCAAVAGFQFAMTRPMSLTLLAPSSALISSIAARWPLRPSGGEEFLDHGQFGAFDIGQFLTARPVRTARSIRGAA
jgi:hypothetical protein